MKNKPKIAIIGSGGYVFPVRLVMDVLSFPELQECEIALMDINAGRLRRSERDVRSVVERNRLPARVTATRNRRSALDGADYVIIAFQIGGLEAYRRDVEIPRRYGLDQTVGDTLGPGGVFRAMRTIPVLVDIANEMKKLCPGALMIQYANPMSMNCWAVNTTRVKCVGFCHSVQGTSWLLAKAVGVPYEECTYKSVGINHQAWFVEFRHGDRDILPEIRRVMGARYPTPRAAGGKARTGQGCKGEYIDDIYWPEHVRTEIMRMTGYFHTESSHHGSEYTPWFRKSRALIKGYMPVRWDYYQICRGYEGRKARKETENLLAGPLKCSAEYGAPLIHSLETGTPRVVHGNVPNWGPPGTSPSVPASLAVPNLPANCCVEVPCLVNKGGVQPTATGPLPTACAAVNRSMINVQELAVEAALTGNREKAVQAISVDPLTGALMTLPRIRRMVEDMFRAEAKWLPQFRKR